jgi:hypothetical protein
MIMHPLMKDPPLPDEAEMLHRVDTVDVRESPEIGLEDTFRTWIPIQREACHK